MRRLRQQAEWWLAVLATAGCLLTAAAQEVPVEATGMAPGTYGNARTMALTNALSEAVRKGVGADIISTTTVDMFELKGDHVFVESFGYVRDYRVVRQELGHDGLYRVTVSAIVGKGQKDDKQVLRMIVKRKGVPRVKIEYGSRIRGLDSDEQPKIDALLTELAEMWQMMVVDTQALSDAEERRKRRDKLLGDTEGAAMRTVRANYDFLIRAIVRGQRTEGDGPYGLKDNGCVVAADLSAIWGASAETVATVAIDSTRVSSSISVDSAVARLLRGQVPATKDKNAETLFRRIIARWIAELDLGTRYLVEFKAIGQDDWNTLVETLRQTDGIGLVSVKEYDSRLISTLLVESTLKPMSLAGVITRTLPAWQTDRAETTYLQFIKKPAPPVMVPRTAAPQPKPAAAEVAPPTSADNGATEPARPPPKPTPLETRPPDLPPEAMTGEMPPPGSGSSGKPTPPAQAQQPAAAAQTGLPGWLWAIIGAGVVLVLGGVYKLGARKGNG